MSVFELGFQGKGKMNTYWLIGHKNYSVQNDSLVCHWNPNISRKKKTPVGSNVSIENVSVLLVLLLVQGTYTAIQSSGSVKLFQRN